MHLNTSCYCSKSLLPSTSTQLTLIPTFFLSPLQACLSSSNSKEGEKEPPTPSEAPPQTQLPNSPAQPTQTQLPNSPAQPTQTQLPNSPAQPTQKQLPNSVLSEHCRLYFGALQRAIKEFVNSILDGQPPETFISHSKLVIMVGQRLVHTLCNEAHQGNTPSVLPSLTRQQSLLPNNQTQR